MRDIIIRREKQMIAIIKDTNKCLQNEGIIRLGLIETVKKTASFLGVGSFFPFLFWQGSNHKK